MLASVVVQSLSHVRLCDLTNWAHQAPLSSTISQNLLRFMSIELVMLSNHLIICHPFSFCLQFFPASESFQMSQHFTLGDQSIGASASAMNSQDWFPIGLTGLISLLSKGLSRAFSSTTVGKHQFFDAQPSLWSSSHICTWLLEQPQLWLYRPLLAKWCLYFWTCCLGLS